MGTYTGLAFTVLPSCIMLSTNISRIDFYLTAKTAAASSVVDSSVFKVLFFNILKRNLIQFLSEIVTSSFVVPFRYCI